MSTDPDRRRDPAQWLRRARPRTRLVRAVRRVRRHAPHLLLAASAAGLAYLLASLVFTAEDAVFAPIAAVVATGLSAGQRLVRAVEISAGVVLGLVMADLLTRVIGAGPWQLAIAVLLGMSAAVALRASQLMANQAAVAGVFVMVLVPLQDTPALVRLGDAMIGGAVAVALNAVLAPDPHRIALTTSEQLLERLAAAYRELARALDEADLELARAAHRDLARLETAGRDLQTAIDATGERITLAPARVRLTQRRRLRAIEQLAVRAGIMVTSARSTARAVATIARHGSHPDAALVTSVDELAEALLVLRGWVRGQAQMSTARDEVLRAAVTASTVLRAGPSPAEQALAWQVRAAAVDMLRVLGLSYAAAVRALEDAAGRADRPRQP